MNLHAMIHVAFMLHACYKISHRELETMATSTLIPAMAKRGGGKHASELRWGSWSPDDLRKAAEGLKVMAGFFEGLAHDMEAAGIRRLRVDGDKKYDAALKSLRAFGGNVKKALIDHETRGM